MIKPSWDAAGVAARIRAVIEPDSEPLANVLFGARAYVIYVHRIGSQCVLVTEAHGPDVQPLAFTVHPDYLAALKTLVATIENETL